MTLAIKAYRRAESLQGKASGLFDPSFLRPAAGLSDAVVTTDWVRIVAPVAGPTGSMILLLLAMRNTNQGTDRPVRVYRTQRDIAADLGVSTDTVRTAIRHLEWHGLLNVMRVGRGGDPTLYEIPALQVPDQTLLSDDSLLTECSSLPGGVSGEAVFSECRRYRYRLYRLWDAGNRPAIWMMLNPSTADAGKDDLTIRRCIGFSRGWGYGGIVVLNLFGIRSKNLRIIFDEADPVGPQNDPVIRRTLGLYPDSPVIAAWGRHGKERGRAKDILQLLKASGREALCLGMNLTNEPRHPLYLPKTLWPVPYGTPAHDCRAEEPDDERPGISLDCREAA